MKAPVSQAEKNKAPVEIGLGKGAIAIAAILAAVFLLFFQLGHYALWDDETMVGLLAKGVLKTGDTSALVGNGNIVAYRSGLLLRDFCDRATPPLATYCTALSFAVFGENSLAARLPFALFGVATVVLLLYWARNQPLHRFALVAVGILCNVTFFLNFRQCRYYGPTIFFTTAMAYLYLNWRGGWRPLLWMALAGIGLFFSNYLLFLVVYLCLGVDYLFWKRKESALQLRDWVTVLLPQVVLCGVGALVWNPFRTAEGGYSHANDFWQRVQLVFWNFRDLNECEYYSWAVLAAAIAIGLYYGNKWLLRASVAVVGYIVFLSFLSPQLVSNTSVADVRYAVPLLPLGIFLSVGVIDAVTKLFLRNAALRAGGALALGVLVFATNAFNGNLVKRPSTIAAFVGELLNPPPDPFRPTAAWIQQNVKPGESVYVAPDYATYPLMFHAPQALYAWQFKDHSDKQFDGLAPIHFKGEVLPDYIVGFGPYVQQAANEMAQCKGKSKYQMVARMNVFWKDAYRPELFWRTFQPIANFNPDRDAVYVFKRVPSLPLKQGR